MQRLLLLSTRILAGSLVLVSILSLSLQLQASGAITKNFSDESFPDAQRHSVESGRLLIINFSNPSSASERMEDSTWSDPTVQRWIHENAIALDLPAERADKDLSLKPALSQTIVVFEGWQRFA